MTSAPAIVRRAVPVLFFASVALVACGDDASSPPTASGNADAGAGAPPPAPPSSSTGEIDDAALGACPSSDTLIETTDWPSCLAGLRIAGAEPFDRKPCELRIGADGAFEYHRDGALAIAVPARDAWRSPSGTYQNAVSAGRRAFLAGIAPDVKPVEGEPRVTRITLNFFTKVATDDVIEIAYLDAALANRTYNCEVAVD